MSRWFITLGALGGFAGVAAGASAQHLAGGDPMSQNYLDLASRYLLIHALAVIVLAGLAERVRAGTVIARVAASLFLLGMVLFGGGLISSALTHNAGFDILVPFGGTSFLLGWLATALYGFLRGRQP